MIFFMKEGIHDHFCKLSSDFKLIWQVTIFHSRLPQIPNHGLGLRQGWNSENSKKWVWLAQNDFFHERSHTRSILQSFKWFQANLTSYHISQQTSPDTKSWIGLRQGWNFENFQKLVWLAQNDFFHERRHTRSFLQSFKWNFVKAWNHLKLCKNDRLMKKIILSQSNSFLEVFRITLV